jgi:signal peptide peptidase SppA
MFNAPYLMIDTLGLSALMHKAKTLNTVQICAEDMEEYKFSSILQKDGERALIEIDGPIVYGASIIDKIVYGAVDTQEVMQAIAEVAQDPKIKDVVFAINSPGGSAHKMHVVSNMAFNLSKIKNTASVNTGMMASAAYFIGSQATKVFIDDTMNRTGSIGTKVILHDTSQAYKNAGVEVIPVATGDFKAMLDDGVEITPEHVEAVKEIVNELQENFNHAVERGRPNADMSDGSEGRSGKTFSFQKAQDLGLIDGVKSVDEAFKFLANGRRISKLKQSI